MDSIRLNAKSWRLSLVLLSASSDLITERLFSADPSVLPLLEAGLELLRLIDVRSSASWLQWTGGPRGVFHCAKSLYNEGLGRGDPCLHCETDVPH